MRALLVALCLTGCTCASVPDLTPSSEKLVERVLASTVRFRVEGEGGVSFGAGWVLDETHIVTAKHVVEGAVKVSIQTRAGEWCTVGEIHEHPEHDLALAEYSGCSLKPLPVRKRATEGVEVWATGHPLDARWSVTRGVVMRNTGSTVELDLVILPGMSGGPVVDATGAVVATTVALHSFSPYFWGGKSYAVKVNEVLLFLPSLEPSASES